jgi:hypothetical protein
MLVAALAFGAAGQPVLPYVRVFACRDDFGNSNVGQTGSLRRIGNPPPAPTAALSPEGPWPNALACWSLYTCELKTRATGNVGQPLWLRRPLRSPHGARLSVLAGTSEPLAKLAKQLVYGRGSETREGGRTWASAADQGVRPARTHPAGIISRIVTRRGSGVVRLPNSASTSSVRALAAGFRRLPGPPKSAAPRILLA